ncbi:hypothetical protein MKX03_007189 [Papaver bracteatum]|nr:hypothetical protein MKX03_007189 [Papaver bracteatum]
METNQVIIIGGKGSSLSSSLVYAIANGLSKVDIDSSVSKKLYLNSSEKLHLNYSLGEVKSIPNSLLTLIETRACLVLLLNKLIITLTDIRFLLPDLICKTLNQERFDFGNLDFSSALGFLDSFFKLNGITLGETGYTPGELNVLEKSVYGICAILDCCASSLSSIADAVASLSCEALNADATVLAVRSLDSGNRFSIKDVVSVARDFKVLLNGSNLLVGKTKGCQLLSEITEVHGSFRESVKQIHSITLVELNTSVKISKDGSSSSAGSQKPLVKTFFSFAMSVFHLGESSFYRARLLADVAGSNMGKIFQCGCPNIDELRNAITRITTLAACEVNYLGFFHVINRLVATVRDILAWEAVLAIHSLERIESLERSEEVSVASLSVETNQVKESPVVKNQKKNKVTLGKGTVVIKQLLKERLKTDGHPFWGSAHFNNWVCNLSLFFDPKDAELHMFLKKMKEMVESNESRRLPKLPKGTRDFSKEKMAIRERAFKIIEGVFKRHGAMALDTPAFELRETLMGKYGEDSKLVFDLADQGGELCSLRYDLTVPFARYVAMNAISSFKRYQIGKVYRRDNPSEGRFREFYQCDFDIAGQYCAMGPDFEVVKVLTELLDELNIGDYEIKLSHRKLLDGMLEICGVPPEKFRTICSSIDKLDKNEFKDIKTEMVEEKGLAAEVADKIGALIKKHGPPLELLSELKQQGSQFVENDRSNLALKDLEILFQALERSKCAHRVVFDLSLARGLDYYTGVIFEAVFKGTGTSRVGSIAAGGRYDNLIGMFGARQVPAVGVSLGIERVFTIMKEQLGKDGNQSIRATETQVLVSIFEEDLGQAAELVSELWSAKVKAEYLVSKRVTKHMERAKESRIPLMVIVDRKGIVRIRDVEANTEEVVSRNTVVENMRRRLNLGPLSTPFLL